MTIPPDLIIHVSVRVFGILSGATAVSIHAATRPEKRGP
jgi:hypothetical protein